MSHKLSKILTSFFFCLVIVSTSFSPAFAAAPPNDNFADAEQITTFPFSATVDITEATYEGEEPQNCYWSQNTIWYSFTTSENMQLQVDTQGSAISSYVSVFASTAPVFSGLWYLGCNYFDPKFSFTAEAGKTYYFQVGGLYGSMGTVQFNVAQILPPPNDDFENATVVTSLPFDDTVDVSGATVQPGELKTPCSYDEMTNSIWYAFTPVTSGAFSASVPSASFYPVLAVYTGDSLAGLSLINCMNGNSNLLSIQAQAGTTYYFQLGKSIYWQQSGQVQFHLDESPPPYAGIEYNPYDPSIYDSIQFISLSNDPAGIGIETYEWNFGDGINATEMNPIHRYTADGDYTVSLKVTTFDGRTDSATTIVKVRTHDIAIIKVLAPKSASAGQTREIYVYIKNSFYTESVRLDIYKSVPGGSEWINTLTQTVPVTVGNRYTAFSFRYTFTTQDAQVGKVSFRAEATLEGARDALPMDNTAISSPTRVSR